MITSGHETNNGYLCEWIFANEGGRIHAPVISSCIKNKCRQIGITEKGIHAFRRTLNSEMRHSGVSSTITASLLGHTEAVNEHYYTFDISDINEKRLILERINKKVVKK
jgi:integrase